MDGGVEPLNPDSPSESLVRVLTYPKADREEARKRVMELLSMGVEALELRGDTSVEGLRVLGKGCVGVVVAARTRWGRAALKVRRMDADRETLEHEAEVLKLANSVGVGPRLLAWSRDILLMELVEGTPIRRWVEELSPEDVDRAKETVRRLLEKCRRLDEAGIDHGELSRAEKHVIVQPDGEPRIIDFETASTRRRTSNVTAVSNYLFISGAPSRKLRKMLGITNLEVVKKLLRKYKKQKTDRAFQELLEKLNLKTPSKTFTQPKTLLK